MRLANRITLVFPFLFAVAALLAFQTSAAEDIPKEKPKPHYRVYLVADLPIYRQTTDNKYVADTSILNMLAQATIGDTPGFSTKTSGGATNGLIVRGTSKAHDKLSAALVDIRKSFRLSEAKLAPNDAVDRTEALRE